LRRIGLEAPVGAGGARNEGTRLARHELLCFLDDDDAYLPGALDVIRRAVEAEPEQTVWSLRWTFLSGRSQRAERVPVLHEKDLLRRNRAGGASCLVLRKPTFDAVGGFDPAMVAMQDWELWLRLARVTEKGIRVIRKPLVVYDDRPVRRISTDLGKRLQGLEQLLERHGESWPRGVLAFHRARLGALRFEQGSGPLRAIFQWRAPLASAFFMLRSGSRRKARPSPE
jgi:glycosyltransferase involved in cell wall biosynthesis